MGDGHLVGGRKRSGATHQLCGKYRETQRHAPPRPSIWAWHASPWSFERRFWAFLVLVSCGKAAPFPGPLPKSPVKQGTETARNDRFSLHRALARRIGGYGSAFHGPFAKPSFAFSRNPRQPSDRPSPFGGFASPLGQAGWSKCVRGSARGLLHSSHLQSNHIS
jgi:hypothetical protein